MADVPVSMERLMRDVWPEPNSGCWLWGGYGTYRYPQITINSKKFYAHRAAYELFRGPIPHGLTIDHLCRVTWCVNPQHLEAVPIGENIRRGTPGQHNSDKTHCPQGHPYSGDNLILDAGRKNVRRCKICRTTQLSEMYLRRKHGRSI
jgi:hypothetical protein